jgi:hypothetical protein
MKYPVAKTKSIILFPNTDYNKYLDQRMAFIYPGDLDFRMMDRTVIQRIFQNEREASVYFSFNSTLKYVDIWMDSKFRVLRDSLVAHGKLNLPYSDTKEYREILKSKILYWNGKEFTSMDEWNKRELTIK